MNVEQLLASRNTTLESLSEAEKRRFETWSEELAMHAFLTRQRDPRLWQHQREALSLSTAYLSCSRSNSKPPSRGNAALLKLPTGTGKTGVIAVLARALQRIRTTLIITPAEALVRQMMQDLAGRFWHKLDYAGCTLDIGARVEVSAEELRPKEDQFSTIEPCSIIQLLPKRTETAVRSALTGGASRLVLVGTFATLRTLHAAGPSDEDDDATVFELLKQQLDLLIIDEGHYEPAVRWGRAVRALSKPTILLSATPYRNDFKAFNVNRDFVYNFPLAEAQGIGRGRTRPKKIIRAVESIPLSDAPIASIADFAECAIQFANRVAPCAAPGEECRKIIIRSGDFDTLSDIHRAIARVEPAVFVHDRIRAVDADDRRYHSYAQARRGNAGVRFWIHDSKLLEGVDDPCFVAVIFHQNYKNDRRFVQQIGRVLRSTDRTRRETQTAYITAMPGALESATDRWQRYADYEQYLAKDIRQFIRGDTALPDLLMESMPEFQYARDQFRATFDSGAASADDIRLPLSVSVWRGARQSRLATLVEKIEDGIYEADRFQIQPISDMPESSFGFVYYAYGGSALTEQSFFPEWRLGAFVAVRHDDLLLVHDTEGLPFSLVEIGLQRIPMVDMMRLFPDDGDQLRISRMSFVNLDISDTAIRSQVIRTHSFQDTFTDLADHSLIPTSASGVIGRRSRYAGFTRSRVSESTAKPLPIVEFVERAHEIAAELCGRNQRTELFSRFATPIDKCNEHDGRPISILLDLTDLLGEFELIGGDDNAAGRPMDLDDTYKDLCAAVNAAGDFSIELGDQKIACNVTYAPVRGRYVISSQILTEHFQAKQGNVDESILAFLNRNQSFRVVTSKANVVYAHKRFYLVSLQFKDEHGNSPILSGFVGSPFLAKAISEKGEQFRDEARWATESIFGFVYEHGKKRRPTTSGALDPMLKAIREFDVLVCDDGPKEFCDFVGLDENLKRIVMIHAKVSSKPTATGIGSLQVVARQAIASLAFVSRLSRSQGDLDARWAKELRIDGVMFDRVIKETGSQGIAGRRVTQALADPSYSREVWIVIAQALSLEKLTEQLCRDGDPVARIQQLAFFVDAMRTSFARANTMLKVYCPDRLLDTKKS